MPSDSKDSQRTQSALLKKLGISDDPAIYAEFDGIYRPMIFHAALAKGLTHHEAEDVTQDTLITLWKQIHSGEFKYDRTKGRFRGVVRQTTLWRINDYFRKKRRQPQAGPKREGKTTDATPSHHRVPDPCPLPGEIISNEEWNKALWDAALERVKRGGKAKPKQFQIFDAHVLKDWPVTKVMQTLGVSRTQVYLAKHRINKLIKKEVEQLETGRL